MEKLEKDIEKLKYDLHYTYTNVTAKAMIEIKNKLDILEMDITKMIRDNNFDNLQFYKDLLQDLDNYCKNFKYKPKEINTEKLKKLFKENKQVGSYLTFAVFQLFSDNKNYYIYKNGFIKLTDSECKLIEFDK